ncbi:MAG: hypothetical protein AB9869_36120 [Verrucomicrobiia bacterium]
MELCRSSFWAEKSATVDSFIPPGTSKVGFPYGNGLVFDLGRLCQPMGCDDPRSTLLRFGDAESYLVRDFQSLESFDYFGRMHLVYFPNSSSLHAGSETTFVPSYTSRFGGATRRLDRQFQPAPEFSIEPLLPEIERKGVAFVAHHLNGGGGRGPDGVPWTTDHMLLRAFRSRAVLGLEFWNEDTRYRTRVCSHDFCRPNGGNLGVFLGQERGYERHEKLEAETGNPLIDTVLKALESPGVEYNALPGEFRHLALPLEEARRGFISGGNAGGLFELVPFDVVNGLWQEDTDEVEHVLHHGAYDWDIMNLRGLDFEQNADLVVPRGWLQPGEPRRMFMAGGSDAHGDFNYRRAGYFLGTEDANDTAIGKPRNLVFAGAPEGPVIYHEDPKFEHPGAGVEPSSVSGQERTSVRLQSSAAPSRQPPDSGRLPGDRKPGVTDPGGVIGPIEDPILDPGDLRPPVNPPIDVTPPITDPVVDPGEPPPVFNPPDVGGPIEDPILDPGDLRPPVNPPIDVTPPITDPVINPGEPPPVFNPPDVGGPIEDPILDPGDPPPDDPPSNPPSLPPEVGLGLDIRSHTQEQIIRALRKGRFCVTDGPAIRMAIDKNGNQQIDEGDVQMGDVYSFSKLGSNPGGPPQTVTLLTEVISTEEFGPLVDIDVYVGAQPAPRPGGSTVPVEPRMYAPLIHGPGGFGDDAAISPQVSYVSQNRTYVRQKDRYWNGEFLGDNLTWNQTSGNALRYSHTLVTTLDLDRYQVGQGVSTDRFFVRAFAVTAGNHSLHIPNRYAFTNPIWILRTEPILAPPGNEPDPGTGGGNGTGTPPPTGSDPITPPAVQAFRMADGTTVLIFDGTLQRTSNLREPFADVPAAASPFYMPIDGSSTFYRARR